MKLLKHAATLAVAAVMPLASVSLIHATPQDDGQETQIQTPEKAPATIDTENVGWNGVALGSEGERVYAGLRANWVMINEAGGLNGQLVGVEKPTEVFLIRNGFVAERSTTGENGDFRFEAAAPGAYTIVGYSAEAIFSFGFNAVANDGEATGMPTIIQTSPILGAANNRLIAQLIKRYSPQVNFRTYGKYPIGETKADPAKFYGVAGLRNLTEPASPATSIGSNTVPLGPNGTFVGRMHQIDANSGRPVEILNTRVTLISEGQVIAEVQTDQAGSFEFSDVQPGTYGVVASGNDGFAAMSIQLVANGGAPAQEESVLDDTASIGYDPLFKLASSPKIKKPLVSSDQSFDACLCSPESMGWINSHVTEQSYVNVMNEPLPEMANVGDMPYNYFDQSMMYGDMSYGNGFGGGGGGFGGGGFGGGLGQLILPLGVGAILAEALDDDNNLNGGVPVVSPFDP